MQIVARNKVTTLRPLTQQMYDYFHRVGGETALSTFQTHTVWWRSYFGQIGLSGKPTGDPISLDLWDDPGADISDKKAYFGFVYSLQEELKRAKTSRAVGQQLVARGWWPPVIQQRDPFTVPDYFYWWQAENAFRRGFMALYEQSFLDKLKYEINDKFVANSSVKRLTAAGMKQLADDYERDPFLANYFFEVGEELERKNYSRFTNVAAGSRGKPSLKAIYQDMTAERHRAYQQFSPYFQPLRWVPGGGLVGVEPE